MDANLIIYLKYQVLNNIFNVLFVFSLQKYQEVKSYFPDLTWITEYVPESRSVERFMSFFKESARRIQMPETVSLF